MEDRKADYYKYLLRPVGFALNMKYVRHIEGIENIPNEPAIYASNHIEAVDSLLIAQTYSEETGIPLRFLAKKEYFDGLGVDNEGKYGRMAKWIMEHTWQIPVDRKAGGREAFDDLVARANEVFERGESIALHPEGTRSRDGKIHKFKTGVARIALQAKIPIVPVGITYHPRENSRKVDVNMTFSEPVDTQVYLFGNLSTGRRVSAITREVEARVAEASGLERSGEEASPYAKG